MPRRTLLTIIALVLAAVAATTALAWPRVVLRLPESLLSAYLRLDTPLGLPASEVISRAKSSGCEAADPYYNELPPRQSYPKTTAGGSSWTTCVMGSYGIIFETSVEIFYIFDKDDRLKEVKIRRTVDAF